MICGWRHSAKSEEKWNWFHKSMTLILTSYPSFCSWWLKKVPNYDKKRNFHEIKVGYRISNDLWLATFCEKWRNFKLTSQEDMDPDFTSLYSSCWLKKVSNYDKKRNFHEIKVGYRISNDLWLATFCEKCRKLKLTSKQITWILNSDSHLGPDDRKSAQLWQKKEFSWNKGWTSYI